MKSDPFAGTESCGTMPEADGPFEKYGAHVDVGGDTQRCLMTSQQQFVLNVT